MTDNRQSEKHTWDFSSGELTSQLIPCQQLIQLTCIVSNKLYDTINICLMTELGFTWEIPTTNFILRFSEICDIIHILHVEKKSCWILSI